MPDELILKIFGDLDSVNLARMRTVNRRWNVLANDPLTMNIVGLKTVSLPGDGLMVGPFKVTNFITFGDWLMITNGRFQELGEDSNEDEVKEFLRQVDKRSPVRFVSAIDVERFFIPLLEEKFHVNARLPKKSELEYMGGLNLNVEYTTIETPSGPRQELSPGTRETLLKQAWFFDSTFDGKLPAVGTKAAVFTDHEGHFLYDTNGLIGSWTSDVHTGEGEYSEYRYRPIVGSGFEWGPHSRRATEESVRGNDIGFRLVIE